MKVAKEDIEDKVEEEVVKEAKEDIEDKVEDIGEELEGMAEEMKENLLNNDEE